MCFKNRQIVWNKEIKFSPKISESQILYKNFFSSKDETDEAFLSKFVKSEWNHTSKTTKAYIWRVTEAFKFLCLVLLIQGRYDTIIKKPCEHIDLSKMGHFWPRAYPSSFFLQNCFFSLRIDRNDKAIIVFSPYKSFMAGSIIT